MVGTEIIRNGSFDAMLREALLAVNSAKDASDAGFERRISEGSRTCTVGDPSDRKGMPTCLTATTKDVRTKIEQTASVYGLGMRVYLAVAVMAVTLNLLFEHAVYFSAVIYLLFLRKYEIIDIPAVYHFLFFPIIFLTIYVGRTIFRGPSVADFFVAEKVRPKLRKELNQFLYFKLFMLSSSYVFIDRLIVSIGDNEYGILFSPLVLLISILFADYISVRAYGLRWAPIDSLRRRVQKWWAVSRSVIRTGGDEIDGEQSLIVFSGLPGSGKSTIARELVQQINAVYVRIDSIEVALRESTLAIHPAEDAGYRASLAVAADNLALGRSVIADCVNPIEVTRRWWAELAVRACVPIVNVEVICSDRDEHKRRVEARRAALGGEDWPDWAAVEAREYVAWSGERITVDTFGRSVDECVRELIEQLPDG